MEDFMITADLHNHTLYSHGLDTPKVMWESAKAKGIELFGFTEHSPRPQNYTYTNEYREKLTKYFPQYVKEVQELKIAHPDQVLLGIEMDWMEKEQDFIKTALAAYDFDYNIGSVHFLENWGYDDNPNGWQSVRTTERFEHYSNYFKTVAEMAKSGLFNIVGHLDLIKIYSIETFNEWVKDKNSQNLIAEALDEVKKADMAMEISSAGLRKLCKEIYPGPIIMGLAKDLNVPISFGSDAHNKNDVAADFDKLEQYAKSYGYTHSVWFNKGSMFERGF